MKIKRCCDELKEAVKHFAIKLSSGSNPVFFIDYQYSYGVMEIRIDYCPFCGTKLETLKRSKK